MNVFRTLPPLDRGTEYDPDEDEPPMELTWPHLEVRTGTKCHIMMGQSWPSYSCTCIPIWFLISFRTLPKYIGYKKDRVWLGVQTSYSIWITINWGTNAFQLMPHHMYSIS